MKNATFLLISSPGTFRFGNSTKLCSEQPQVWFQKLSCDLVCAGANDFALSGPRKPTVRFGSVRFIGWSVPVPPVRFHFRFQPVPVPSGSGSAGSFFSPGSASSVPNRFVFRVPVRFAGFLPIRPLGTAWICPICFLRTPCPPCPMIGSHPPRGRLPKLPNLPLGTSILQQK